MNIAPNNMFYMLDQRMRHNALSARVTAENMANLNTPAFEARKQRLFLCITALMLRFGAHTPCI